jgi:hypothetical protein
MASPRWVMRQVDVASSQTEATAPSKLEPFHSQRIYASRGITLHADDSTHKVMWLFAYRTSTVDQYLASPLATLAIRDEPID